jgi:hypothetical protein
MTRLFYLFCAVILLASCQASSYTKSETAGQHDEAYYVSDYDEEHAPMLSSPLQGPLAAFNPQDPLSSISQQGSGYISESLRGYLTPSKSDKTYNQELAWVLNNFAGITDEILSEQAQQLVQPGDGSQPDIGDQIQQKLTGRTIDAAVAAAQGSGIRFLQNVELQYQLQKDQKPQYSARTIDVLYETPDLRHTAFAEGGLAREDDRTTMNLGVGYRHMNEAETWLYGVNAFYDRQWPYHHQRASLGLEMTSVDFGLFGNRYVPLSSWQDTRAGYQEKTLGGWDVGISGLIPYVDGLELTGTGYIWERYENLDNLEGVRLDAEYTVIPEITLGASVDQDSEGDTEQNLFVRYNFNAEKKARELKPKSVADLRLRAVNRENRLLVQERQKPSLRGTVVETVGANTLNGPDGSSSLEIGMHIPYGGVVTVSAAGGSYAELAFGDGGILRIGTASQVRIDIGLITLITGTMQYVSGSTNVLINVPGGTITLLGTDIDVVSNGSSSTVRVRDGSVDAEGTLGDTGDIIELDGSPAVLAQGSPEYQNHEQTVYDDLDSIDPVVLDISKAAPYIYEITIQQSPGTVGDPLVFALNFSKTVTLAGGVELDFMINGAPRTATYLSGNGSGTLLFTYTTVSADAGQDEAVIDMLSLNGGSVTSGSQHALTYVPQTTLPFSSGPIIAVDVPVTVSTTAPDPTNVSPIPFTLVFDEAVTGLLANELTVVNGTAGNLLTGDNITWTVDVTPTVQGTVSLQVPAGVAQSAGLEDNAQSNLVDLVYDTGAPSGYSVVFTTDPINAGNQNAAAFQMNAVEIGSTFEYEIDSSGGGATVTGSGTITTNPQNVTGINLSGLNDGTLTVSLTLTSPLSEVGPTVTDTVVKDLVAPLITLVTPPADGVYDDL